MESGFGIKLTDQFPQEKKKRVSETEFSLHQVALLHGWCCTGQEWIKLVRASLYWSTRGAHTLSMSFHCSSPDTYSDAFRIIWDYSVTFIYVETRILTWYWMLRSVRFLLGNSWHLTRPKTASRTVISSILLKAGAFQMKMGGIKCAWKRDRLEI